jgi:pectin methylesterase-like acyl-CoA thioesterase
MKPYSPHGWSCALAAFVAITVARGDAVSTFPANRATSVNPDTHLVLTFPSAPTIGTSGRICIYDATGHHLVDALDLSTPAGPDPAHRAASPPATAFVQDPASPTTTTPAVRTTPPDLHNYQVTTIGGLADFHFYPVIVHGNVATIYPHNNVLRYSHEYIVQIDPSVFTLASAVFPGFTTDQAWRFTTKPAPPTADATRVVVAADGTGDFSTVQGAVDFVPDNPPKRVTIFIRNGNYEEIVFFRKKANLTFRGEDRDKVQVGYGNNSAFNPPMPGPSRRCAFSAYDSTGLELINFSLNNYYVGQAEALLISGSKNIVSKMNIKGSGDALNLRGSVYLADSTIIGDGDTILGVGPAFFRRCVIQSIGPFMWIRNTEANHGNVFVDCTFIGINRPLPWNTTAPTPPSKVLARLPNNHGLNYPYAEAVLIDCRLKDVPPAGWGPIDDDTSHIHFWEFHSIDTEGDPVDVTKRHPVSKQLTQPQDAQTIANYSDPAFVLGGWTPVVDQ